MNVFPRSPSSSSSSLCSSRSRGANAEEDLMMIGVSWKRGWVTFVFQLLGELINTEYQTAEDIERERTA